MSSPKRVPRTRLDSNFWKKFATNYWERKPLLLQNVEAPLLQISSDKIFQMLVQYADQRRKMKDPVGFKFFTQGIRAYDELCLQVLPVKKDRSMRGYHERMESQFPDYCLVCDELLNVSAEHQGTLAAFTKELYSHVGFPNRFAEMGLYLGNYRKTPFGVHVDACGVFSIPVEGQKTFRLWTSAYVHQNPKLNRAFSYGPHKKKSQKLELRVGDLSYWPSKSWHIAESDGSFSATWSLGIWVDRTLNETWLESLRSLVESATGGAGEAKLTHLPKMTHSVSGEITALPSAYESFLSQLIRIKPQDMENELRQSWGQRLSKQGFKSQSQSTVRVKISSRLRLRQTEFPILWIQMLDKKSTLQLIFAGQSLTVPRSAWLIRLLKDLNAGEVIQLTNYVPIESRTTTVEVLQKLADLSAFRE